MNGAWKTCWLLAAWAAGTAAIGCGPGAEGASATATDSASAKSAFEDPVFFEDELLALANEYRVSMGLHALIESEALKGVARDHSVDMLTQKYFAHVSPLGLSAGGRLSEAGVHWASVGENLAEGLLTPREVFEAWLLSPLHRENLARADWTHAGVGVAVGEEGRVVTQLFLRP